MSGDEPRRAGRPRSEEARDAVLHAVDDLLVETGYAAMSMKGIAERAGVGRQTVYRWWATKAEILLEASVEDAREELAIRPSGDPLRDLTAYLRRLVRFLTRSPAGAAYRALIGEAQHDPAVAELIAAHDVLTDSARAVLVAVGGFGAGPALDRAAAALVGPVFFPILSGHGPNAVSAPSLARDLLNARVPLDPRR